MWHHLLAVDIGLIQPVLFPVGRAGAPALPGRNWPFAFVEALLTMDAVDTELEVDEVDAWYA